MRLGMPRWWARTQRKALTAMGIMRGGPQIHPVRHVDALDEFVGKWVAVLDGRVVEAADSSRELAVRLRERRLQSATVEFVPEPTEGIRVGLG